MPSNENENNGRVTRSQSRAQSAASAATKPPVAKPQRKAATNASSTTKGRGGGRKSSSTARSTPAAEDANVVADDGSLILTPDDLSLPEDEQKRKIQTIFTDLGIQDIANDIPSSKVKNLHACLPLSKVDFQKFLKQWVPGYTEKSNDILTLADHLRKAVFPAPSLALVPAGKKDASTKDDVSLRATFFHKCRLPPQSSNGWGQNILIAGIQKQEYSEIHGGDYHYTCLTDCELIDKLQQYDGKKITYKKRWRLVKESWKRDHPGSDFDYTPSTANASHGRNVPVIAAGTPADAAPSLSGSIGSTDANVPRSSDTVAVVPPIPTPRNLRNGNGVAPPADNNNAPHPSESQAVAATSEISLLIRTLQSTNKSRVGAGDGASLQNQLDAFKLKTAERMAAFEVKTAEANFQKDSRIAALEVKHHENTVETHEMINKNNVAISQGNVAISELKVGQERFKLNLAKTDATANRAERKADSANGKADEALESFKNVDERVDGIEDKVYGLEDTVKKCVRAEIAKSRVEIDGVNEDDNDPYASLGGNASFSPAYDAQAAAAAVDDSFDEDEVPNNNIITPGSTSFAARLFPDDDAAACSRL
mmetsp:Transcript_13550/g.17193  ORF Transcript_13550/g.17193 Transcript_13550/m.17193 type:complete len:595 (+) Transcript_13550:605-2389(+)